ncbi:RagB/SusD family nutrient uptake outer membrane protein [uncultured Mucilaginibacter sp.]|uniref:RagB/SusD family nutrient uptake outer membrane protein n=1 Tax=uncultured Mucilaginibacter sp. TaxID=797541 RepID=UPI0025D1B230|nr:RagB/SusD family nutrient uptake outer membrane protein [uncultured Mucilaginibacter sp.]
MKTSYGKYIAPGALVALTLTFSCKKLLNQAPVGSLNGAVLANKAGLDGLLIGAYSMLDGYTNTSGTEWESGIDNWAYGGVAADDAFKGSNSTDQTAVAPIANHTVDPSNEYIAEKWAAFYNAIQRANDVIRELPQIKDGSVSPDYAKEVTAEAKFLRGVFHFELAKMFRNVPYVDESITYGAGNFNVPNPGPIWDKIEADFTAAMAGLPKTQGQIGRANYYAAEAFLAKAYLWDHQYAKAKTALDDLINNGETAGGTKYALSANYEDNYNAVKKNGPESVFAVQMTVNDGSNGSNDNAGEGLNFPAGTYTGCCGFYQPSYTLANAFKVDENGLPMLGTTSMSVADFTGDNKTTTNVTANIPNSSVQNLGNDHGLGAADAFTPPSDALDPRIDWTVGRRGIPYLDWGLCGGEQWSRGDLCPYNPIKNVFYNSQQASTADNNGGWASNQGTADNYNLITLADLYLWRAECEVESSDLAGAMADVNMVRARMQNPAGWVHTYIDNSNPSAGFTDVPAANYKIGLYTTFASQSYAREAVHMEEQLEFGMEGHRFFDLQRWDPIYGGPEPAGYMAGVVNGHIAAVTRIANPVLDGHSFTAGKNELYPIPLQQVTLENGQLKQNPKY